MAQFIAAHPVPQFRQFYRIGGIAHVHQRDCRRGSRGNGQQVAAECHGIDPRQIGETANALTQFGQFHRIGGIGDIDQRDRAGIISANGH
jgi:hypothetical protein